MKQIAKYLSPFGLSASVRTSLVRLATSRPHEVLSELFVPRHIKSDKGIFGRQLLCCVRVFDREKMLKVGGKKEKKRKRERKKRKKHTNSIARIRAGASPPAVSFTCLKLHHAAPRKQDTFDRRISCHDHATHLWKRNTSHTVWEANKDKEVKLIVQISFAEKIKFKEEGSVTFQNFFLR